MDSDDVNTTENLSVDQCHEQRQSCVEADRSTEDTQLAEATSAESNQSSISAAEQSHRDDDDGKVAATTSDSTIKNVDKGDDDSDYIVDTSSTHNIPDTK